MVNHRSEKISFFTTKEDKEWWWHRYHQAEYESFSAFIATQLHQVKQQIIEDEKKVKECQDRNQKQVNQISSRSQQRGSQPPKLAPVMRRS